MTRVTYEQLASAPELASLALLETALDIAGVALAAAWPELHDYDLAREHPEPRAALDILHCASLLLASVNHYRLLLATAEARELDFPF